LFGGVELAAVFRVSYDRGVLLEDVLALANALSFLACGLLGLRLHVGVLGLEGLKLLLVNKNWLVSVHFKIMYRQKVIQINI